MRCCERSSGFFPRVVSAIANQTIAYSVPAVEALDMGDVSAGRVAREKNGRPGRSQPTSPGLPLRLWPCHDLAEHRMQTVSSSCRGPDVIAAAPKHTNTVIVVTIVRSVVVAVRTTNVVPGAPPQNATENSDGHAI